MTVISQANPVGIDNRILMIQNAIEKGLDWDNIDIYGRLYVNKEADGKVENAYIGGGDYNQDGIFLNDKKNAIFGFFVDPIRSRSSTIKATVTLVCSCNLTELFGNDSRRDEKALLKVLSIVDRYSSKPNNGAIITDDLDKIYSLISTTGQRFTNKQPWFSFAIGFNILYKNTVCANN